MVPYTTPPARGTIITAGSEADAIDAIINGDNAATRAIRVVVQRNMTRLNFAGTMQEYLQQNVPANYTETGNPSFAID